MGFQDNIGTVILFLLATIIGGVVIFYLTEGRKLIKVGGDKPGCLARLIIAIVMLVLVFLFTLVFFLMFRYLFFS